MVEKSLDLKLARLRANPDCGEFIIADAKDADMAYGIAAPGHSPEMHTAEGRFRSLAEYRRCIRDVVHQGAVDILLMSAHTSGLLTIGEALFEGSPITPAARANDTTDIHLTRGGIYASQPSCPFQSTTIDHIQCGHVDCRPDERGRGANLGLYSITFNNDVALDRATLEQYKAFRLEAERKGFRHFLEVFDPNAARHEISAEQLGGFINDQIVRTLAGVPESGRPLFLKMVYHGSRFTEELSHYDPTLIVGVLGGAAGTTYDAFKLLAEAQKYGARAALFGRKINQAEHQLAFIAMLRRVAEGDVSPEEAVHAYHGVLQALGIRPQRCLEDDLKLTDPVMSYGVARTGVSGPGRRSPTSNREASDPAPVHEPSKATQPSSNGRAPRAGATDRRRAIDFSKMSSAERLAYHRQRLGAGGNG